MNVWLIEKAAKHKKTLTAIAGAAALVAIPQTRGFITDSLWTAGEYIADANPLKDSLSSLEFTSDKMNAGILGISNDISVTKIQCDVSHHITRDRDDYDDVEGFSIDYNHPNKFGGKTFIRADFQPYSKTYLKIETDSDGKIRAYNSGNTIKEDWFCKAGTYGSKSGCIRVYPKPEIHSGAVLQNQNQLAEQSDSFEDLSKTEPNLDLLWKKSAGICGHLFFHHADGRSLNAKLKNIPWSYISEDNPSLDTIQNANDKLLRDSAYSFKYDSQWHLKPTRLKKSAKLEFSPQTLKLSLGGNS